MKSSSRYLTSLALASFVFAAPVAAQEQGSMQVGGATVSVGVGTAIIGLPEVEFGVFTGPTQNIITRFKSNDDFIDEYGLNINGTIAVPMGANQTVSLSGFHASIDASDTDECRTTAPTVCTFISLVEGPGTDFVNVGNTDIKSDRDVDYWGVSLESKWQLNPGVMGVTRAPKRRHIAVGADIRGIDQKIDLDATFLASNLLVATLDENLDTRYYGGYLAWGGDYSLPIVGNITSGLGLKSTFQLRGGVYYADTDYDGVSALGVALVTKNVSLSRSDTAFIGGLTLETSKQFGARTTLSLKSDYEYYSYVPDMNYNENGGAVVIGPRNGTSIGSDDAFSARTTLRLTIKLGPDSVFEKPLK